jgi:hypothetical protein
MIGFCADWGWGVIQALMRGGNLGAIVSQTRRNWSPTDSLWMGIHTVLGGSSLVGREWKRERKTHCTNIRFASDHASQRRH